MASYSFVDHTIRIYNTQASPRVLKSYLNNIRAYPDVMVPFTHEFIHSIQSASSPYGIRLLTEFLSLAVFVVAVALGKANIDDDTASWEPFSLIESVDKLSASQLNAAMSHMPAQFERASSLSNEISVLFIEQKPYKLLSENDDWHLAQQVIGSDNYQEAFWGVVTPDGLFWAFTPGMLAENMARRIDRKLAANIASPYPDYEDTTEERGYYNGLYNLLKANESIGALGTIASGVGAEELTVLLAQLALMSRRPDHAAVAMLEVLTPREVSVMAATSAALAEQLMAVLRASQFEGMPLWGLGPYQEAVDVLFSSGILAGITEGNVVRDHLLHIGRSVKQLSQEPLTFATPEVRWLDVVGWMERFGLPPTKASDGMVDEICGVAVRSEYSEVGRALGIIHHRVKSYRRE